jgi:hypothetical protein
MDILKEIDALKREYMSEYAAANPEMANVTLRLLSHVLGEYGADRWVVTGRYQTLTNAHLLRVLHGMGLKLKDRWNHATAKPGGNLDHVFRFLLEQYTGYGDETAISGWSGSDYWDDCYIALAVIEGRRDDPACDDDSILRETADQALRETIRWMAEHAKADFPHAADKEWFGPGFHAAALQLFDVVALRELDTGANEVIEIIGRNLETMLESSRQERPPWDAMFAWHIGQVVSAWCRLSPRHPSLLRLRPLIYAYYAELIAPARRRPDGGWIGINPENVVYGTARALAAAYEMEDRAIIAGAHAFIAAQMDEESMLQELKGRVNMLETLQMKMNCRLPSPELHLTLELGARLMITGLYEPILKPSDPISARNKTKTLHNVRDASRDALERSGESALQPLGVNAELLKFATQKDAVLKEFDGERHQVIEELKTFLTTTMTEVRAETARSLLRRLWTRRGTLHYAPFFDCLAKLEHDASFFSDYRDHVNHQILVFLLGTYMYYHDTRLRDALRDEIERTNGEYVVDLPSDDDEFLFRWKMASTFHDVGYMFEVSPTGVHGPADALITRSVEFVREWVDGFLVDYLLRFDGDMAAAQATFARVRADLPPYAAPADVEAIFDLRHSPRPSPSGRRSVFTTAATLLPEHLGTELLEPYFDLCRNVDPGEGRARFYDHGIMSAAVLLKTADVQHHHLTALRKLANEGRLAAEPTLSEVLLHPTTDLNEARFFVRFAHAAGAIALHNIYPKLYVEETCRGHGKLDELFYSGEADPRHFRITPDTPLAYMLACTDGLQNWDRHSFRPPSVTAKKTPLSAHEILFAYHDGKLRTLGLNPAAREQCQERLATMKITLGGLDDFVTYVKDLH